MEKERLQQLLAEAQTQERQAFAQLVWVQGKIAQLEELLALEGEGLPQEDEAEEGENADVNSVEATIEAAAQSAAQGGLRRDLSSGSSRPTKSLS